MKNIYLIRHCVAAGQSPEAPLTEQGEGQARELAEILSTVGVDRIISSPFKRAVDTFLPLAMKMSIEIETDSRLAERVLSTENLPDWFEKLKSTFDDLDLKLEGGESSREAMTRIVEVVGAVFNSDVENTILVSHGNLLSLLLKHYDNSFGFEEWRNMSNPDVYLIKYDGQEATIDRLWK